MNKRILAYTAAAMIVASTAVTATAVSAEDTGDGPLTDALNDILSDARLNASQTGLVVADAETGETVYDHNGQMRAIPASNTKLLTSTAAMGILGPDYTFATDVATAATVKGHTVRGDVYLRGTGDPTMLAEDYDSLAAQLADAGITKIKGDLVADDTAYDSTRLGPEWGWDDLPYYYAAEVSALTVAPDTDYDAGNVIVNVDPGDSPGDPARITMTPPNDYVDIDNRVTTGESGDTSVNFDRALASGTIVVSGRIATGDDTASEWVTVHEPTGYAADVFAKALASHGIKVSGDVRVGEPTPDGAKPLADHDSMPLSELLVPFMKLSNNGHAETLVKAIGREASNEGSWEAGLAAIATYVGDLGMDLQEQRQSDGSGMSRWNNIPPRDFAKLLVAAREQGWFDTWYQAQPIACEPDRMVGGTLRRRMCDTPAEGNVHAKTGSLTGVSSLSGYVTDADGRELVFSFITNDFVADSVLDVEDAVAVTLASYSDSGFNEARAAKVKQPESQAPVGKECSWVKPIAC